MTSGPVKTDDTQQTDRQKAIEQVAQLDNIEMHYTFRCKWMSVAVHLHQEVLILKVQINKFCGSHPRVKGR